MNFSCYSSNFKQGFSLIAFMMSVLLPTKFVSAAIANTEVQLNGTLIHKIATYLTWQKASNQNLSYCFFGQDSHPIGDFLNTEQQDGKLPSNISVNNLLNLSTKSVAECDLLYIDKGSFKGPSVFNNINKTTFTITNSRTLLSDGFIVSIELEQDKPLLTLSKSNLKSTNILVDARLLSVVNLVK